MNFHVEGEPLGLGVGFLAVWTLIRLGWIMSKLVRLEVGIGREYPTTARILALKEFVFRIFWLLHALRKLQHLYGKLTFSSDCWSTAD